MEYRRTLFIELDGASWNIINPLIEADKLPNIRRLIKNGASGKLMSIPPLISPKIWTSMFTGKTPAKTGINFFGGSSKMVKCKRIWDIFSEDGLKVGIFGSFVTWPPYEVNGYLIPSIDSVGPETFPPKYQFFQEFVLNERRKNRRSKTKFISLIDFPYLAYKLKHAGVSFMTFVHALNYFTQEKIGRFSQKDRDWKKAILHLKISLEVFMHLHERFVPDFSTFHIHTCDFISHRFWKFYAPSKLSRVDQIEVEKYKSVIPDAYIEADRSIGRILSLVDENTTVVIASDHGFEAISKEGYNLRYNEILEIFGIRKHVIAVPFGGGVYLHFKDKKLMHQAAEMLKQVCLKQTKEKILNVKISGEVLVLTKPTWKMYTKQPRQDLLIDFGDNGEYRLDDFITKAEMSGWHSEEGVFIISGPIIRPGARLEKPSIYDISPTLLALMNYPVARDMDGRVLTEALREEFIKENPIRYIDTYEDSFIEKEAQAEIDYKKIEERLEGLGYL